MAEDDFRFRRQERLLKRRQFLEVYGSGRKAHQATLVVYVRENDFSSHRLGLTVSRRIGKAVVRNRIKRRLRELFRLRKKDLPGSLDIVVNVKRAAARASYQQLGEDLNRSLARVMEFEEWRRD